MLATAAAKRQAIAYIALLVISLLLLAFSSTLPLLELRRGIGFAMAPIQASLRDATRQVSSVFAAVGQIEQLRQENADLARKVDELEIENQQLEVIRQQNEELAALLAVRSTLDAFHHFHLELHFGNFLFCPLYIANIYQVLRIGITVFIVCKRTVHSLKLKLS